MSERASTPAKSKSATPATPVDKIKKMEGIPTAATPSESFTGEINATRTSLTTEQIFSSSPRLVVPKNIAKDQGPSAPNNTLPMKKKKQEPEPLKPLTDFYLFGDRQKKLKENQEKLFLTPSKADDKRIKTTIDQYSFSFGDIIMGNYEPTSTPVKRTADILDSDTASSPSQTLDKSFLKRTNILASKQKTLLDEVEEETLRHEIADFYKTSSAKKLLKISKGASTLTEMPPNISYFLNDYDRFLNADKLIASRPASSTTLSSVSSRRGSRPSSSVSAAKPQDLAAAANELRAQMTSPPRSTSISPQKMNKTNQPNVASSSTDVNNNKPRPATSGNVSSSNSYTQVFPPPTTLNSSGNLAIGSKPTYLHPQSNFVKQDPTFRSYLKSPSCRVTDTIFSEKTRLPTQLATLMENNQITNESFLTYITTEFVEEINIEGCYWLSNAVIETLGQFCQQLRILNLQGCHQIVDRTIKVIVNGCPNLLSINLGRCTLLTDDALSDLFSHSSKLKVLSIHSCPKINGSSFKNISKCKDIEVMDFSFCENLSDWALQYVSEFCSNLVRLDVSGCPKIGDDGIKNVVQHCPHLETLRLNMCCQKTISGFSLMWLTKFGTSLRILELTSLNQVTDEISIQIAKWGQGLEFLSLSGCTEITDATITEISTYCKNLWGLELCNCRKLTLNSLLDLVHSLKKLKKLVISECNVSKVELDALKSQTERVEIVKQEKVIPPKCVFVNRIKPKKKLAKGKKGKKGKKKK